MAKKEEIFTIWSQMLLPGILGDTRPKETRRRRDPMESRETARIRMQLALNELMFQRGEVDEETFRMANIALLERLTRQNRGNTM